MIFWKQNIKEIYLSFCKYQEIISAVIKPLTDVKSESLKPTVK